MLNIIQEKTYSIAQVADALQIHRSNLYRRIEKGTFPEPEKNSLGKIGYTIKQLEEHFDVDVELSDCGITFREQKQSDK